MSISCPSISQRDRTCKQYVAVSKRAQGVRSLCPKSLAVTRSSLHAFHSKTLPIANAHRNWGSVAASMQVPRHMYTRKHPHLCIYIYTCILHTLFSKMHSHRQVVRGAADFGYSSSTVARWRKAFAAGIRSTRRMKSSIPGGKVRRNVHCKKLQGQSQAPGCRHCPWCKPLLQGGCL